ncbi:cbb3-type cytochrome oxidase assembly protein CcoS [Flagellimonas myxillae]|uniref:cbb3-type cytochrome oxidase assembly protein CcoS n=1 Tax=Flagellimonas myxillae TaxID=2942214 RepID=UPI00201EB55E|nr:cbb3-type cytochrome oxidase assembly protein CcoS [Muricauda myxillae]MCL6267215.1 cbb3-type cytochrome oxidase assembly protein CcoS [Muricauda myxillae]
MSVIYVLLAISIAVALVFFAAFVLSVKNGQYDDAYTPSVRMLFEDELLDQESQSDIEQKEITQTKRTNQ